jgi:DNA-binding NarL/FixJ family response regulator
MSDQARIRVLSVDDHPLLREGIAKIINDQTDMTVVAQAGTGGEAIQQFTQHRPDIVLLDLRLPDMSGIDVLISLRGTFPDARVVILTTSEGDVEIQRALQAGAQGYLLKSIPQGELTAAIRRVHAGKKFVPPAVAAQLVEHLGEAPLTAREIEVLRHVAGGNRNRDIAQILFVSEETVKVHLKHVMEKLGASDRTEAIAIALRRGIIAL